MRENESERQFAYLRSDHGRDSTMDTHGCGDNYAFVSVAAKRTPREYRTWLMHNCTFTSHVDFIIQLGRDCTDHVTAYLSLIEARCAKGVSTGWSRTLQPHDCCEALGVFLRSTGDLMRLFDPVPKRIRALELRPCTIRQQLRVSSSGTLIAAMVPSLRSLVIAKPRDNIDLSPLTALVHLEYLAVHSMSTSLYGPRHTGYLSGLSQLSCLSNLQKLDLTECDHLSEESFQNLGLLTQLRELVLVGCRSLKATTAGLQALSGLTRLETLHLGDTWLKGEQLFPLRRFPALTWLDLSEQPIGLGEFIALGAVPLLRVLRVAPPAVTDSVNDWYEAALQQFTVGLVWFRANRSSVQVYNVQFYLGLPHLY